MTRRFRWGTAVGNCLALVLSAAGFAAADPAPSGVDNSASAIDVAVRGNKTRPTVSVHPKQVTEGDRFRVTARAKSPARNAKATLYRMRIDIFGVPQWEVVQTTRMRGKKATFSQIATDENSQSYRVAISRNDGKKPRMSATASVTIWRWVPLSEYSPYYDTGGTSFGTEVINGRSYRGWGAVSYSHIGTWEGRFTPGRHCTSFSAVAGLSDISADGSSGSITLSADDVEVYTSPVLTPGMSVPFEVAIAQPYRFGIQLFDTTPGGTTGHDDVESWPALGDPAFFCTGV